MGEFTVRNPDYEAVVRASFAQQGLMAHLGARMTRVEPGMTEIEVDFRPELTRSRPSSTPR